MRQNVSERQFLINNTRNHYLSYRKTNDFQLFSRKYTPFYDEKMHQEYHDVEVVYTYTLHKVR